MYIYKIKTMIFRNNLCNFVPKFLKIIFLFMKTFLSKKNFNPNMLQKNFFIIFHNKNYLLNEVLKKKFFNILIIKICQKLLLSLKTYVLNIFKF